MPRGWQEVDVKLRDPDEPPDSLGEDEEGAVYTEYTVLLVLVALVMSLAIAGLGVPFVHYYRSVQTMIFSPMP
jgi:Flp pilus assembly pilin Flp